jgi:hypothetical protein
MKKIILSLIILIFFACTKEVNLDLPEIEDTVIAFSIFNDKDYFKVLVSKTSFYGDTLDHFITDANVVIKAQKSDLEKTLDYQGNGYYFDTTFFPQFGEVYHLNINVDGYKALTATDSMPNPPDIKNVYITPTNRYDISNQAYRFHEIYLTLYDPSDIKNYYEALCYEIGYEKDFFRVTLESEEAFIVKEGDQKLYNGTLLFNDEMINGEQLEIKLSARININHEPDGLNTAFHIASISPTLYRYRKQEIRHIVSGYDLWNPIEPVPMYSNITNGYGVFAGYSSRSFLLHHENK